MKFRATDYGSRLAALASSAPVRHLLSGAHATALRLASTAITLVFGILAARLLGAEVFGDYVALWAVAGLVATLTSIGVPTLLTRELAASRGSGDRSALKAIVQGAGLINGAALLLTAALFALGYVDAGLIALFVLAANAVGLLGAAFAGMERVLLAAWLLSVARPLAALALLYPLALALPADPRVPLAAQIAGPLIATALFVFAWRGPALSVGLRRAAAATWWSPTHKAMIRAGVLVAGTQFLTGLTTQIDILILTALRSPEDVGHYYAAARAALVVSFFYGTTCALAEPTMTRLLAAGERTELVKLVRTTSLTAAAVTLGAALVAVALGRFYLSLSGPSFLAAFPTLCILSFGLVGWSLFGPSQNLLRAARLDTNLLLLTAVALAVNAVVTAALVPFLGIEGAAIGTSLQFAVYGALLAATARRRLGIATDLPTLGLSHHKG